jgi:hypothetical protein
MLIAIAMTAGCSAPPDEPLDTTDPTLNRTNLQALAESRANQTSNDAKDFAPELLSTAEVLLQRARTISVESEFRELLATGDQCLRDAERVAELKARNHTIPFPPDRSLGKISFSPWGKNDWRFSAQARGDIAVSAHTMTGLEAANDFKPSDLNFLASLDIGAIQYLTLGPTKVPAASLSALKNIRGLRDLSLANARYTGDYITHIQACPWLRMVNLLGNDLTDQEFSTLAGMPSLELLAMDARTLTGAAFETVATFPRLRTLITRTFDPGDQGVAHLARCPNLEHLWISGTGVTDASVRVLKQLTRLRGLVLIQTSLSDTGLRELEEALTECKIERMVPIG